MPDFVTCGCGSNHFYVEGDNSFVEGLICVECGKQWEIEREGELIEKELDENA